MENVVVSVFAVESEAYQAFAELKQTPDTDRYNIIEAALLKNENGRVVLLDDCGFEEKATDDTAAGAVVGGLIGVLGGPFGVILGAVMGGAFGSTVDADDAIDDVSTLEVVAGLLKDGEIAIMTLVKEFDNDFDVVLQKFNASTTRYEAGEIAKEVERARELEKELAKEAREKLRAERKAERAAEREERRAIVENLNAVEGEMVFNAVDGSSK